MRRDVVGLGVALAVGGLAYGSSYRAAPSVPPPQAPVATGIAGPAANEPPPSSDATLRPKPPRFTRRDGGRSIATHMREAATRYRVSEALVAAVISVESEFNPRAVSRRGALGLMQLMPGTAALLGVRDAFDPAENVDAGARHLRELLDRFANDVALALAAYNAGAQAVIRHGGVLPYPETRAFVARVLGRIGQVAMPTAAVVRAQPAGPPRVRFARLTADRLCRDDDQSVVIAAVLRADGTIARADDTIAPPVPAPAPAWSAPSPSPRPANDVVAAAPAVILSGPIEAP